MSSYHPPAQLSSDRDRRRELHKDNQTDGPTDSHNNNRRQCRLVTKILKICPITQPELKTTTVTVWVIQVHSRRHQRSGAACRLFSGLRQRKLQSAAFGLTGSALPTWRLQLQLIFVWRLLCGFMCKSDSRTEYVNRQRDRDWGGEETGAQCIWHYGCLSLFQTRPDYWVVVSYCWNKLLVAVVAFWCGKCLVHIPLFCDFKW